MKCDELKAYNGDVTIPVYGTIADAKVYLKKSVDAAIAELKSKADAEIRRLKRALWLSRAEMARTSAWVFWNRKDDYNYNKWKKVEFKCRAKAEEYK